MAISPAFWRIDEYVKAANGYAMANGQVFFLAQPANTSAFPPTPQAQLYADPFGMTPISQPLVCDGFGHVDAYVSAGTYTMVVALSNVIQNIYPDQSYGVSSASTVFETNGVLNPNQGLLNLVGAGDITITQNILGQTVVESTGVVLPGTGNGSLLVTANSNVSTAPQGTTLAADGSGNAYPTGNSKVYASVFPGATLDVQITAAFNSLGGNPGTVLVDVSGGTLAAPITMPVGTDLVGASKDIIVNIGTGSGSTAITMLGLNAIRNLTFSAPGTGLNSTTFIIYSNAGNELEVENVVFQGGYYQLYFNACTNFRVIRTVHNTIAPLGGCITFSSCSNGQLISPRVEGLIFNSTAVGDIRTIWLYSCAQTTVLDPLVYGNDFTSANGGSQVASGLSFSGCQFCSVTGGVFALNLGCDGVLCEASTNAGGTGSRYINITGVLSQGNSSVEGSGGAISPRNGDGFDIFNSSHIYLTNCQAYNNGAYKNSNQGYEIFNCYDVVCTGCLSQFNGGTTNLGGQEGEGFQIVGSPYTKLVGCTSSYNYANGVNIQGGFAAAGGGSGVSTVGTTVTYIGGGTGFGANWEPGTSVYINGVQHFIASMTSTIAMVLTTSAGTQNNVSFAMGAVGCVVDHCTFESNGNGSISAGFENGVAIGQGTIDDFSTAIISGCTATDQRTSGQTQKYGLYISSGSSGRAVCNFNNFRGNVTGTVLDNPGLSPQIFDDGNDVNLTTNGSLSLSAGGDLATGLVILQTAAVAGSGSELILGNSTGVGSGGSTNLTALAKGGGSGPTSDVAVAWLKIFIGSTAAWIPVFE